MALKSSYQQFLSRPSPDALADAASLLYVPTSVTIEGSTAIIKHFSAQSNLLKKKENILNTVEGPAGLCVEAETTIQFEGGGGTYLPGLDDNFLVNRTVSLPIVSLR